MNHITWSVVSQSRYLRMSVRAERQMVGVCEVAARVAGLDAAACERVLRRWGVARVRGCPVPSASLGGAALSAWGGACRRAGVCAAEVSAEAAELGAALPAGWAAALAGRRGRPKAAALQVVGVAAPSDAPSAGDVFAELAAEAGGAAAGGAAVKTEKAAGASQGGATPSKKKAGAAPALLAALHPSEGAPDDGELGEEAYEATFTKGGAKPALGASQGGASQGGASGDPPSEETEVSVRVFEHEGVRWLKDDDDVLYDPETHEEVGRWSEAHQVVEL